MGEGYTFVGAVNLHLGIALERHLEPDAPYSYITSAALEVSADSLALGPNDPLPPTAPVFMTSCYSGWITRHAASYTMSTRIYILSGHPLDRNGCGSF